MRRRPLEPEPGNAGGGMQRSIKSKPPPHRLVAFLLLSSQHGTSRMRVVIFANGEMVVSENTLDQIGSDAVIVCADGGTRHALALNLTPALVVGDMDSVDMVSLERLRAMQVPLEVHPVEKDATDLELALLAAQRMGADHVLTLGVLGGRLDQTLANLLLMASPQFAAIQIGFVHGQQRGWIVRQGLSIAGQPGDTISCLALSPQVTGLTYHSGLAWQLRDDTLVFGSSRAVSNLMTATEAVMSVRSGVLLVMHLPQAVLEES